MPRLDILNAPWGGAPRSHNPQRHAAYRQAIHTLRVQAGQISESQLGIYFYNARDYDPYLNRFIQADALIPQPGNSLAWDRYAYVNSNPINFTDPSGNMSHMDDNGWVFDAPEKPDNLTEDGEKAYVNIWLYYFHRGEDWTDSKDAELNAAMLYNEVGSEILAIDEGEYITDPAIREAAARRYNEFCSDGSWSAKCINSYWGYYQPIRNASKDPSPLNGVIDETREDKKKVRSMYSFSNEVINHDIVGYSGYDPNRPFGWGNVYSYYDPVHTAYQHDSVGYLYFVVLTPNQQLYYCDGKWCNLSYQWITDEKD